MLTGSHRFSNDLNTKPSKMFAHNLHRAEGFNLWKLLIASLELIRLVSGFQVLWSSVYPDHFTRYSNFSLFNWELRISSTLYSELPSTFTASGGVACCPATGGLYGHTRDMLITLWILKLASNFSLTAFGDTTLIILNGPSCHSVSFCDGKFIVLRSRTSVLVCVRHPKS